MRIEIWRTGLKDTQRKLELEKLQRDLEAHAADERRGAALRQLRQIMARQLKGEKGLRLEVWRQQMKIEAYARHRAMQEALEAQMRAQGQGAGLRMLRMTMARLVRGELGMRIEIWRTCMRDEKYAASACGSRSGGLD